MKINSDRVKVISPQGFTSLQQLCTIIHHFGYFWDKKFHLLCICMRDVSELFALGLVIKSELADMRQKNFLVVKGRASRR